MPGRHRARPSRRARLTVTAALLSVSAVAGSLWAQNSSPPRTTVKQPAPEWTYSEEDLGPPATDLIPVPAETPTRPMMIRNPRTVVSVYAVPPTALPSRSPVAIEPTPTPSEIPPTPATSPSPTPTGVTATLTDQQLARIQKRCGKHPDKPICQLFPTP